MIQYYKNHFFQETRVYTRDFMSISMSLKDLFVLISHNSDIYSLGLMIYYIMKEREYQNLNEIDDFGGNSSIEYIFHKCIEKKQDVRPSISELIFEFYVKFYSEIDFERIQQLAEESFKICYGPDVSSELILTILR